MTQFYYCPCLCPLLQEAINVENVRGYEKAGRCSIFNKVNLLLMIKRAQLI
jgi:hypothetical protein